MIQTAEGALNETHSILQRMRELSVQAANGTLTSDDRSAIADEVTQLKSEVDRIATTTEFNTKKLLNGGLGAKATITSGNEVTSASVTGDIATAGSFTVDLTQVGQANVKNSNAPTKNDGSGGTSAVTLNTTSTLNDLFKDGSVNTAPFNGSQQLVIGQGSNTINVSLKGTDTIADVINTVNQRAEDLNMNLKASFNTGDGKIEFTSTETGVANAITVSETGFGTGVTFGFADKTAAKDYQYTVTNNTTGITSATLSSTTDSATINDTTSGLSGLTVKFGNSAGGTSAVVSLTKNSVDMQIGANANQTMEISINDMRTTALGVGATGTDANGNTKTSSFANLNAIDVSSSTNAQDAIITIDEAIKQVSTERGKLGAYQNRLDHTINNLGTSSENLTAAESRIRDVDYALAA